MATFIPNERAFVQLLKDLKTAIDGLTSGGPGTALTNTQLRATPVPVSGTFFQATQPVSAASLPLPTGASTAALQTQPGVDIGDVTVNNGAAGAAVNIQDGGNSLTVDGTVTANQGGAPWSQNITQVNGVALLAGNGATGTGSPRVTIANDNNDVPGDVKVKGVTNTGQTFAAISVSNSAVALPTTPLSGRRLIVITNVHATLPVNIGPTSGVTGGVSGLYSFRLVPEESRIIPCDGSVTWHGIRDSASAGNVNVTEFK